MIRKNADMWNNDFTRVYGTVEEALSSENLKHYFNDFLYNEEKLQRAGIHTHGSLEGYSFYNYTMQFELKDVLSYARYKAEDFERFVTNKIMDEIEEKTLEDYEIKILTKFYDWYIEDLRDLEEEYNYYEKVAVSLSIELCFKKR